MTDLAEPRHQPQGAFLRDDGAHFCVWAPFAETVSLVAARGAAGGAWDEAAADECSMQEARGGYFTTHLPSAAAGLRYAYRLNGGPLRPDPATRWQPDGVNEPSALFDPAAFHWTDGDWKGVAREDLVIYELHVGTFTTEGTFAAVIPRLPELRDLGVTAIEVMPVAQFSGQRNWGYDGVHPYAAQNSYGGPHGLQQLVDAGHACGLAVILDVVYNHLGPEGNYLHEFGPYFTDHYHTPWGAAINYDGPDCDPVRRFVCDNVRMWVREFHVDGLRLDAIQTIYDFSARHILADVREAAHREGESLRRPVHVIGETNQNDAWLTAPAEEGGIALDAVWSDDLHHSIHALLTGERQGYYLDFGRPQQLAKALERTFVYDGCYSPFHRRRFGSSVEGQARSRFVVCIQNHDQVGNRACGDRLDVLVTPAARRLAAALLLLAPGTPLLFMGEEYGETNPFPFFCSFENPELSAAVRRGRRREFAELDFEWTGDIPDATLPETFESARLSWSWPAGSDRARLREMYRTLLAARRESPLLRDRDNVQVSLYGSGGSQHDGDVADDLHAEGAEWTVLMFQRGPALTAFANLTAETVLCPPAASGEIVFSTEAGRFGGARNGETNHRELLPFELIVFGDPDSIGLSYDQQAVDA